MLIHVSIFCQYSKSRIECFKNLQKFESWTTSRKALASETDQTELINELMAMVTSSLVCADFCKKTAELGGGALAIDFMRANIDKASGV